METLEKLFGSSAKVKIMRLFIFNPDSVFDSKHISIKSKIAPEVVRREVGVLAKVGLIKKKKARVEGRIRNGWILNHTFSHLTPLEDLLIHLGPLSHEELIKRLYKAGRIKFVVVSGVFSKQWEGRVDVLVVGDKLKKVDLERVIRNIEAEIGKDLHYAALDTIDFKYRLGIGDKLIRDIFDYPHEVILNKLGIDR